MKTKLLIRLVILFAVVQTVGSRAFGGAAACAATLADVPDSCYISTLPYVESFHNCTINVNPYVVDTHYFVPCWGRMTGSPADNVANVTLYRTAADTMIYVASNPNKMQYVILPPLADSLIDGDSMYLLLHYYTNSASSVRHPQVGAMSDPMDSTTFRPIAELPTGYSNDIAISLSSLTMGEYVVIRIQPAAYQHVYIYDVKIDRTPRCGVVCNFRSPQRSLDAVYVQWDYFPYSSDEDDSVTFEVKAYTEGQSTPVSTVLTRRHHALIGGLAPQSTYQVTITPLCAADTNPLPTASFYPYQCTTSYSAFYNHICREPLVIVDEVDYEEIAIEWAGMLQDSLWNIYMRYETSSPNGPWTLVEAAYSGNSYRVRGLEPSSRVSLRVTPVCDTNLNVTSVNRVTVHLPCRAIEALPWVEDFESFSSNCWVASPSHSVTTVSQGSNGRRALGVAYDDLNQLTYTYYMLPEFVTPLDSLTLSGELQGNGLLVGVAHNDGGNWVFAVVDTVRNTTDSTWETFTVDLSGSPYAEGRIFVCRSNEGLSPNAMVSLYVLVDNLRVERSLQCLMPTHVMDSAVSRNSAYVLWNRSEEASIYEVEYGPHGFSHGEGLSIFTTNTRTVLVGLAFGTRYDVYVRAYCNRGDTTGWTFPITFITSCSDISTLPWIENIDLREASSDITDKIPCWSSSSTYTQMLNINWVETLQGNTVKGLVISTGRTGELVSLPRLSEVNHAEYLQAKITAWAKPNWDVPVEVVPSVWLEVGVGDYPVSVYGYTPVDTLPLTYEPTEYDVIFSNYTGYGRYITTRIMSDYNYSVYLSHVELDMAPYCLRPDRLSVSHTPGPSEEGCGTEVLLDWHERGEATLWQVAYRPCGEEAETVVTANSHPFLLTGLTPGREYEFRVRSLCSEGNPTVVEDTTGWSSERQKFITLTPPAEVPYSCDFEDTVEASQWVAMSNNFFNWHYSEMDSTDTNHGYQIDINTTLGSFFRQYSELVTRSVLFRDVDFGPQDSTESSIVQRYNMQFQAKLIATWQENYNLRVYLADAEELPRMLQGWSYIPVRADEDPLWEPDSLHLLAEMAVDTNWQTFTLSLDTVFGIRRLLFMLSNNTRTMQVNIDNVQIVADPCPRPLGLHADLITDSVAEVSWAGSSTARYEVNWGPADAPMTYVDTVMGAHVSLAGLTPTHRYSVQVALLCDSGLQSSLSTPLLFTTLLCNDQRCDSVLMDSLLSQRSNVLPVSLTERYSYSQQLFPANVFAGAGTINAVNLNYQLSCTSTDTNNYLIYMGHTDKQHFANANDFIDPTELSLVYAGPLPQGEGWNKIVLDSPFPYDGSHNLVLAIVNSGNTAKPQNTLLGATSMNTTIELRGNSPIEPTSPEALRHYIGNRNAMAFRCQAFFDFCPNCVCQRPQMMEPDLRYQRAVMMWQSTAAGSYELNYRPYNQLHWNTPYFTTDTSLTIYNLTPGETYICRVRSICPPDMPQGWTYQLFHIEEGICPSPQNMTVANLAPEEVTLQWDRDEELNLYYLRIFNTMFDTLIVTADNSATITTLLHGVLYNAAVHATCSNLTIPGLWSDTVSFTTLTCPDATALTYSSLGGTSVVLDWNSPDTITMWEISYGEHGFHNGQGTSVIATHHPYRLTGLESLKEYDVYVRALCGEGFFSEHWSNCITFTTRHAGIAEPDPTGIFTLTPNPAKTHFSLTLTQPIAGPMHISVRDAHGRTVCQSNAVGTPIATIDWPAGIYFVTLTTPLSSSTRKIIVE